MSEVPQLAIKNNVEPHSDEIRALDLNSDGWVSVIEAAQMLTADPSGSAKPIARLIDSYQQDYGKQGGVSSFWNLLQRQCKRFDPDFDAKKFLHPHLDGNPDYSVDISKSQVYVAGKTFTIEADGPPAREGELIQIAACLAVVDPDDLEALANGLRDSDGSSVEKPIRIILTPYTQRKALGMYYPRIFNELILKRPVLPMTVLHEINHAIDDMRKPTMWLKTVMGSTYHSDDRQHPFRQHSGWQACQDLSGHYNEIISRYSCKNIQEGVAEWYFYTGGIGRTLDVLLELLGEPSLSREEKVSIVNDLVIRFLGSPNQDVVNKACLALAEGIFLNPSVDLDTVLMVVQQLLAGYQNKINESLGQAIWNFEQQNSI